jgi:intracellular sulfur oxidation DsrE/DsrF family protein
MILRRSFLTHLGAGVTAAGAAMASGVSTASAQSTKSTWTPEKHERDDWFDQVPGKHRLLFDTSTAEGFGSAVRFANTFLEANRDYGLKDSDLAVVVVARHQSTGFAYNETIWSKYGQLITRRTNLNDPKTKQAPMFNLFNASGYGGTLSNNGVTVESLVKRGVHLAVCNRATHGLADMIAAELKRDKDEMYEEFVANLFPNAHIVPAGIVAVNRAQERGYTMSTPV